MTQNLNCISIYDLFLTGSTSLGHDSKSIFCLLSFQIWHKAISATFTFQHSLDWDLKDPSYSACIATYFCLSFSFKYLQMVSCFYTKHLSTTAISHLVWIADSLTRNSRGEITHSAAKKGKDAAIRFLWEPVPTHLGDQSKEQLAVLQQQPFLRVI